MKSIKDYAIATSSKEESERILRLFLKEEDISSNGLTGNGTSGSYYFCIDSGMRCSSITPKGLLLVSLEEYLSSSKESVYNNYQIY